MRRRIGRLSVAAGRGIKTPRPVIRPGRFRWWAGAGSNRRPLAFQFWAAFSWIVLIVAYHGILSVNGVIGRLLVPMCCYTGCYMLSRDTQRSYSIRIVKESPWWGVPIISGIFAFVAIILAQMVVLYNERRRVRREDAHRWHSERRAVYARFAKLLREDLVRIEDRLKDGMLPTAFGEAVGSEVKGDFEEVSLLASPKVADAAERAIASHEHLSADRDITNDDELINQRVADASTARKEFIEAARLELGVIKPDRRFVIISDSLSDVFKQTFVYLGKSFLAVLGILAKK